MAERETGNSPELTPAERATEALKGAHTLCMERTGFSYLADIPTRVTVSVLSKNPPKPLVSELRIRPDEARLISPYALTEEEYESSAKSKGAVSEAIGARRIYDVMNKRVGQADPQHRKPIRYSLNGKHDLNLLRHFLWREGYSWKNTEQGIRVIDVSHALCIVSALQRSIGAAAQICPKEYADFDRDPFEIDAHDLCASYGLKASGANPAGVLMRLVYAAREAEYDKYDKDKSQALTALGGVLDHLEGVAGILPETNAISGAKERAWRLATPVRPKTDLDPAQVGLLLKNNGTWVPVVTVTQAGRQGNTSWLYTLPDGEKLSGSAFMSKPLMRLDLLSSAAGWDEAADERLRVLTDHKGEDSYTFDALSKTYKTIGADWGQPPPYKGDAPIKSNSWTQIYNGWPSTEHYADSYQITTAIASNDKNKTQAAFGQLAETLAGQRGGRTRNGGQILLENLKTCASRDNMLGDGRVRWLEQISKQQDPEAWPSHAPIDPEVMNEIISDEGPIGDHNRRAMTARKVLEGTAGVTVVTQRKKAARKKPAASAQAKQAKESAPAKVPVPAVEWEM